MKIIMSKTYYFDLDKFKAWCNNIGEDRPIPDWVIDLHNKPCTYDPDLKLFVHGEYFISEVWVRPSRKVRIRHKKR